MVVLLVLAASIKGLQPFWKSNIHCFNLQLVTYYVFTSACILLLALYSKKSWTISSSSAEIAPNNGVALSWKQIKNMYIYIYYIGYFPWYFQHHTSIQFSLICGMQQLVGLWKYIICSWNICIVHWFMQYTYCTSQCTIWGDIPRACGSIHELKIQLWE